MGLRSYEKRAIQRSYYWVLIPGKFWTFVTGGGFHLPSMLVVALGKPGVPVTCCA